MADTSHRRRLPVLAVLIVTGAAATAAAAGLTWWNQSFVDSLAGTVNTRSTGSQSDPLLLPVALLGLAGFGAALATAGLLRRAVGAVLVLSGGGAATLALIRLASEPATLRTDLTRPAESSSPAQLHLAGPLLGSAGGLVVALSGVLLLAGFGARSALGSRTALGARYDAPTSRRRAGPAEPTALDPAGDPDAATGWWKALDAGRDPTQPVVGAPARAADACAVETADDSAAADRPQLPEPMTRPPGGGGAGVCGDVTRGG